MSDRVTGTIVRVMNTDTHQYFIANYSDNGTVRDALGLSKDLKIIRNHFCLLQVGDQVDFRPEWSPSHGRYNAKEATVDITIESMPEREVSEMAFVSKFEERNRYFCKRPCGCRLLVRFQHDAPRVKLGEWMSHTVQEDVLGRFFATDIQKASAVVTGETE